MKKYISLIKLLVLTALLHGQYTQAGRLSLPSQCNSVPAEVKKSCPNVRCVGSSSKPCRRFAICSTNLSTSDSKSICSVAADACSPVCSAAIPFCSGPADPSKPAPAGPDRTLFCATATSTCPTQSGFCLSSLEKCTESSSGFCTTIASHATEHCTTELCALDLPTICPGTCTGCAADDPAICTSECPDISDSTVSIPPMKDGLGITLTVKSPDPANPVLLHDQHGNWIYPTPSISVTRTGDTYTVKGTAGQTKVVHKDDVWTASKTFTCTDELSCLNLRCIQNKEYVDCSTVLSAEATKDCAIACPETGNCAGAFAVATSPTCVAHPEFCSRMGSAVNDKVCPFTNCAKLDSALASCPCEGGGSYGCSTSTTGEDCGSTITRCLSTLGTEEFCNIIATKSPPCPISCAEATTFLASNTCSCSGTNGTGSSVCSTDNNCPNCDFNCDRAATECPTQTSAPDVETFCKDALVSCGSSTNKANTQFCDTIPDTIQGACAEKLCEYASTNCPKESDSGLAQSFCSTSISSCATNKANTNFCDNAPAPIHAACPETMCEYAAAECPASSDASQAETFCATSATACASNKASTQFCDYTPEIVYDTCTEQACGAAATACPQQSSAQESADFCNTTLSSCADNKDKSQLCDYLPEEVQGACLDQLCDMATTNCPTHSDSQESEQFCKDVLSSCMTNKENTNACDHTLSAIQEGSCSCGEGRHLDCSTGEECPDTIQRCINTDAFCTAAENVCRADCGRCATCREPRPTDDCLGMGAGVPSTELFSLEVNDKNQGKLVINVNHLAEGQQLEVRWKEKPAGLGLEWLPRLEYKKHRLKKTNQFGDSKPLVIRKYNGKITLNGGEFRSEDTLKGTLTRADKGDQEIELFCYHNYNPDYPTRHMHRGHPCSTIIQSICIK